MLFFRSNSLSFCEVWSDLIHHKKEAVLRASEKVTHERILCKIWAIWRRNHVTVRFQSSWYAAGCVSWPFCTSLSCFWQQCQGRLVKTDLECKHAVLVGTLDKIIDAISQPHYLCFSHHNNTIVRSNCWDLGNLWRHLTCCLHLETIVIDVDRGPIVSFKCFQKIMMSHWGWPLTFWISNVITSSFYPFRYVCHNQCIK